MKQLLEKLTNEQYRGVVRDVDGNLYYFTHNGVVDLYKLLISNPSALRNATLVDRVIGRGAALLMVAGGVSHVHGLTMSTGAIQLLKDASVDVSFDKVVDYIINRAGDGRCPVETATINTSDPNEAITIIGQFLKGKGLIK